MKVAVNMQILLKSTFSRQGDVTERSERDTENGTFSSIPYGDVDKNKTHQGFATATVNCERLELHASSRACREQESLVAFTMRGLFNATEKVPLFQIPRKHAKMYSIFGELENSFRISGFPKIAKRFFRILEIS